MDMEIGENGRKHHCSHTMVLFTNIFVFFLLLYVCSSVYVFFCLVSITIQYFADKKKKLQTTTKFEYLAFFSHL